MELQNTQLSPSRSWTEGFEELRDFITHDEIRELTAAFSFAADGHDTCDGADEREPFVCTVTDILAIARERKLAFERDSLSEEDMRVAMLWLSNEEREEIRDLALESARRGSENMLREPDLATRVLSLFQTALGRRSIEMGTVRGMVKDMRMVTEAQGLHRFRELNYALGNRFDFARSMLEPVNKTMVAIQTSLGGEKGRTLGDQVMEVVKGGELKNYIRTGADFKKWLDASTQSAIATGGNVTPAGMFQTFKYARSAVHGWDTNFLPFVSEHATGIKRTLQSPRASERE